MLGGALLLALGGLTWRQSGLYANAETLWQATLTANPGCWAAHNELGSTASSGREEWTQAIAHLQSSAAIAKPDYADRRPTTTSATALLQKGAVDEAIAHYQSALQIMPNFAAAHCDLGIALLQKGRVDEAIAQYQRALQINPTTRQPVLTSASPSSKAAEWTKRSPVSKGRCKSSPTTRQRTTTLASLFAKRAEWTKPSPSTKARCNQPRLRGCPYQPGHRSGPKGKSGGSHHPVPTGAANRARRSQSPK